MRWKFSQGVLIDNFCVSIVDELDLDLATACCAQNFHAIPQIICVEKSRTKSSLHDWTLEFTGGGSIKLLHSIIDALVLRARINFSDVEAGGVFHITHFAANAL